MAITGYTVNGAGLVVAKISGSYVTIGYTQDGTELTLRQHLEEIMTDVFGTRVPQDFQDMMMEASLSIPFIAIDATDLLTLMNLGDKSGNTDGTSNTPGLVLGAGGYGTILGITAPLGTPWYFQQAFIADDKWRTKLATKAQPVRMNWRAIPKASYTAVTGAGTTLYARASI